MGEAVNTVTSGTGTATVVTSDTVFKVVYKTPNHKNGVYVYFNYDENGAGTVTITFDILNPNIHATNLYRMEQVLVADGTIATVTLVIAAADHLYRVFVPMAPEETTLQVNTTIQTTTQTGILTVEFQDN
jgi:hypothetical protein